MPVTTGLLSQDSSFPALPHLYMPLFLHVGPTVTSSDSLGFLFIRSKILPQSSVLASQTPLYWLQGYGHREGEWGPLLAGNTLRILENVAIHKPDSIIH